ncbi:MAG: hypothetical protein M1819_007415 [Sarea resinae]|nr:MAG: hypothetical protein M1819_007415 [Sarea resinae]
MPPPQGKFPRSSFGNVNGNSHSALLDKAKMNARRSTPDSEVLASSDDEQDNRIQTQAAPLPNPSKPARRSSWLNEIQPGPQRKPSFANPTFSPVSPHPTTPSGDQNPWATGVAPHGASNIGRGSSGSASYPWGNGIWNHDTRKDPPSRLSEVLSAHPVGENLNPSSRHSDDPLAGSSYTRRPSAETALPFAIPLHPTPKTYRSQSYSVGQMEAESTSGAPAGAQGMHLPGRMRAGQQQPGLQHRPSRPSLLNEVPHDGTALGRLREVEDDEESPNGSLEDSQLSSDHARNIARENEQLAWQNALLRQQVAATQAERLQTRNRAATINFSNGANDASGGAENSTDRSEYAIDEADDLSELQDYRNRGLLGRRFSEYGANVEPRYPSPGFLDNRKLESIKKAHWSTSLDFGGLAEIPQSRRHSFADVPTRHPSVGSIGETPNSLLGNDLGPALEGRHEVGQARLNRGDSSEYALFRSRKVHAEVALEQQHLHNRKFAASYFSGMTALRNADQSSLTSPPTSIQDAFTMQNYGNAASTNSRDMYGIQQHPGLSQPRQNQLLYVVTFKCCRADVFYIQEGTGLHVKPGDLVIVEADRGTDLGTVAHENVTWAKAKECKEFYAEEHYKWLMMFSRQGQAVNPNGMHNVSNGVQGSASGGMGPPQPGQHGMQDPPSGELKPKMIKRLAQNHEIQTLRDKEGNEAKAKRVCQQKVVEHRLNMEILDAEFQMDWKKLTFYYFADSYINFNSLVTDLFKVYKTRIWMSAINPASFATPSAGLQPPSGIGPGALGFGRENGFEQRQQESPAYGGLGPYRNFGLGQATELNRDTGSPMESGPQQSNQGYQQSMRAPARTNNERPQDIIQNMRQYGSPFPNSFSPFATSGAPASSSGLPDQYLTGFAPGGHEARKSAPLGNEWMNRFQDLSLGSR